MTVTSKTIALTILAGSIIFCWGDVRKKGKKKTVNTIPAQESSEANVSVTVTPRVLFTNEKPVFDIAFETHSVDLAFDVTAIAILKDQNGNDLGDPKWDGSPPGGHHRSGSLSFSKPLPQTTQQVLLTLKDIAGVVKRTFTWEVKAQ